MAAERVGITGSAIGMDAISGRETYSGSMKNSGSKVWPSSGGYAWASLLPKNA